MTLIQLNYFIRIAELKSLSKAAAALRIAQPALSRQVRNLELELGSVLLVRHAWGVTPTHAGELLIDRARKILLDVEEVQDSIAALLAEPRGRVSIGTPTSLARAMIPPLARALREKHPHLRPYFVDGFSATLHARMLVGELDLAVLYEDRAMGPIATRPLLSERLMVISAAIDPVPNVFSLARLKAEGLALPARPNRLRLIADQYFGQSAEDEVGITEVDSLPALIALVRQGGLRTLLPYSAVVEEVERGELCAVELKDLDFLRVLVLARPFGRPPSAAVQAVETEIALLVEGLAASFHWTPLAAPEENSHAGSL